MLPSLYGRQNQTSASTVLAWERSVPHRAFCGARAFVRGHFLRVLERAAISEIGGDPGRTEAVIADRRIPLMREATVKAVTLVPNVFPSLSLIRTYPLWFYTHI